MWPSDHICHQMTWSALVKVMFDKPDDIKPLPYPILINHLRCLMTFTCGQFEILRISPPLVWPPKLLISNYNRTSKRPMSKQTFPLYTIKMQMPRKVKLQPTMPKLVSHHLHSQPEYITYIYAPFWWFRYPKIHLIFWSVISNPWGLCAESSPYSTVLPWPLFEFHMMT